MRITCRQFTYFGKICILCLALKTGLYGADLLNQSINSGGGWVNGTQNSSFTIYGELFQSTIAQPGQFNSSPIDLNSTAPLTIAENQPIGTTIGEFNATDPDANATLIYSLVDGNGSTDNSLFILDANGTLKTATTFNYESNASTYSIRVQAKDELNATLEGNFTVKLENLAEVPIINGFEETGTLTKLIREFELFVGNITLELDSSVNSVSYQISGQDSDFFELNQTNGDLYFKSHTSFQNPFDDNSDNIYEIGLIIVDSNDLTSEANIVITVVSSDLESWEFTNAGSVGALGPMQTHVYQEYFDSNLAGTVLIEKNGWQEWEIPADGFYYIGARGASGGIATIANARGGYPAFISGKFYLRAKEKIIVLVGQVGESGSENGAGGGATFVFKKGSDSPLIVAGGGGGGTTGTVAWNNDTRSSNGANASLDINGTHGINLVSGRGENGEGGSEGSSDTGAGGGWLTSGGGLGGANIYLGTGNGGTSDYANGGFGGGGATFQNTNSGGGGGGGYSGGGGGKYVVNSRVSSYSTNHAGGGGGSFFKGNNGLKVVTQHVGDGAVRIALLSIDRLNNNSPEFSSKEIYTIAENQPIGTIVGEFNATDPDGGCRSPSTW